MANEQNLIPLTTSKAREIGKKGGKVSAQKRAERKTLKEELLLLLSSNQIQNKISLALIEQAQKGNTRAFEIIRDTIGEKPKDNIQISGEVNNPFKDLSTDELRQLIKDE